MPQSFPVGFNPQVGAEIQKKYRSRRAQLGDGYQHRSPDGLNIGIVSTTLKFGVLSAAKKNQLVAFFDSLGGWDTISYTLPGEASPKLFDLKGVTIRGLMAEAWEIECQIEQVYG